MDINIKDTIPLIEQDKAYFEGISRLSNISSLASDDDDQISLREDCDRHV
jgi:hypothetical protein